MGMSPALLQPIVQYPEVVAAVVVVVGCHQMRLLSNKRAWAEEAAEEVEEAMTGRCFLHYSAGRRPLSLCLRPG